ncbi:hypothetical protein A2886_02760 [candidate division WWE3 bacterium RIFCSPHIGHO2_01_FULL_42_13]|uniref:Sodium/calcium exchanger membrane region domain-containing protein n=1 Tax=candidate division WWE3 bacterium RIFCSPHIGHO2_01_FULL_42_13 TaxID=1802617 RepID=A0A1F4URU9_UNCKA|nr:MAG: hypothetical protein A2886_02760 [candidate division WWE3 bacterium RIFCSPHIGHO2_01_FULL_42_13]
MVVDNLLIYLISFIAIWLGAGLVISSVDGFSRRLGVSSFAVSFLVLGLLTSIPEFAVGLTAISENDPEIFVGNLLGGITVIFLFIIPVLAILGNGIRLTHKLDKKRLISSLIVIAAPTFFVIDHRVTNIEGAILIALYVALLIFIQRENRGIFGEHNERLMHIRSYSLLDVLKLLLGIGIVFISSRFIVDQTIFFSQFLRVSPFVVSLVILSLGTNLPELSLALRAVINHQKDIALGDYLGSAAANTLFFGIFTLLNGGEVLTVNSFLTTFVFIALALGLFYHFSRSQRNISRNEGAILMLMYIIFAIFEFTK